MARPSEQVTTGFDELLKELRGLPNRAAGRLERVLIANHLDHRKEVLSSSDLSAAGKRGMRHAILVYPKAKKGSSGKFSFESAKKISDIEVGTVSYWTGPKLSDGSWPKASEGAAARIEKSIGDPVIRAESGKMLLIPQGDFVTPTGRPRKVKTPYGRAPIDIAGLPNVRAVKLPNGRVVLIQTIDAGAYGAESRRASREGGLRGVKQHELGRRERIVGVLKKQVKAFRGLDFFGSWERTRHIRERRFKAILDDWQAGKL